MSQTLTQRTADNPDLKPFKAGLSGLLLKALDSHKAALCIIVCFSLCLLCWDFLDHRVPSHDSAWHAIYSSSVKRFLIHPKEWNLVNLQALGKQHFAYPPGAWAFNGILKVFFGDGFWGDKLCLLVQSLILAISFYKLAIYSYGDRVKANLGLILIMCFPLVCALQRQPLIDLYQLALYTACMASLLAWCKNPGWKNASICSALMGLHCLSKQTAVLYAGPVIAGLFLYYVWKRRLKECIELFVIGISGPVFLLSLWVLPNFQEILNYMHWRTPPSVGTAQKLVMMLDNLKLSSSQIFESAGPTFLCLSLALLFKSELVKTLKRTALPIISALIGWLLIISLAYYNTPEPRYFGPVLVPLALLIGALAADALKSNYRARVILGTVVPVFAIVEMLVLCFQPSPLVKAPVPLAVSPACDFFGLKEDTFLRSFIGYDRASDPWKQEWIFKEIAKVEHPHRFIWLNVLPSTREFDQGSLIYLGQRMKSKAIPITWRSCMNDMSDSFKCSEDEFNLIDWFVMKTGSQGALIKDPQSAKNFQQVTDRIEHGGDYVLMASSNLPDQSVIKLYRKDYAKIWIRNSKKKLDKQQPAAQN